MAEKVIINKSILTDIGNAIREKEESSDLIPSTEMATRIRDFQGGAKIISGGKSAVPVDGTTVVDTIFSDTSKSIEEVDAILSQLTYIDGLLGAGVGSYILFYGTSGYDDNIIFVNKITNPFGDGKDIYTIQTSDSSYLFYQNYDTDGNTFGWLIEDIPNGLRAGAPEFKINMASTTEIQGMPVGAQNELLKDIIYVGSAGVEKTLKGEYNGDSVSITKPENVNISALIDEQKIPLAVNVDIPTYDGGYENGVSEDNLTAFLDSRGLARLFYNYTKSDINDWINKIDFSRHVSLEYTFWNSYLSDMPIVDTSNIINWDMAFQQSKIIKFPTLDYSKGSTFSYTWSRCLKMEGEVKLELSQSGIGANLYYAFAYSNLITSIIITGKLRGVPNLCQDCTGLESLYIQDTIPSSDSSNFIKGCKNLINLTIYNIKTSITIGSGDGTGTSDYGTLLSVDSLVHTIKELVYINGRANLIMGTANLAKIGNIYVKLTGEAEEDERYPKYPCEVCNADDEGAMTIIAYANSKNWTIA